MVGKASIKKCRQRQTARWAKTAADYPNLMAGLQARAHRDEAVRKIPGGNFLRAWTAIEAGKVGLKQLKPNNSLAFVTLVLNRTTLPWLLWDN